MSLMISSVTPSWRTWTLMSMKLLTLLGMIYRNVYRHSRITETVLHRLCWQSVMLWRSATKSSARPSMDPVPRRRRWTHTWAAWPYTPRRKLLKPSQFTLRVALMEQARQLTLIKLINRTGEIFAWPTDRRLVLINRAAFNVLGGVNLYRNSDVVVLQLDMSPHPGHHQNRIGPTTSPNVWD